MENNILFNNIIGLVDGNKDLANELIEIVKSISKQFDSDQKDLISKHFQEFNKKSSNLINKISDNESRHKLKITIENYVLDEITNSLFYYAANFAAYSNLKLSSFMYRVAAAYEKAVYNAVVEGFTSGVIDKIISSRPEPKAKDLS